MPKSDALREIEQIAPALVEWFRSQEIRPAIAVAVMGYLIGVMAAEIGGTPSEVADRIKTVTDITIATAIAASTVGRG